MKFDMLKLRKLPQIDVDYKDVDLVRKNVYTKKFPDGYDVHVEIDRGSLGVIRLIDLNLCPYIQDFAFDMEFIGRNKTYGINSEEYYFLAKKNEYLKYKIYLKSFLKDLNMRVLYTLQIWDLLEREVGKYPSWDDLKMLKWFRK